MITSRTLHKPLIHGVLVRCISIRCVDSSGKYSVDARLRHLVKTQGRSLTPPQGFFPNLSLRF